MRFWIYRGEVPKAKDHFALPDGAIVNFTPAYTEFYYPFTEQFSGPALEERDWSDTFVVYYWFQLSAYDWMVALCWEDHFGIFKHLLTYPSTAAGFSRAVSESCPTFRTLIVRSESPTEYDLSLLETQDPDTNEQKWLLASFFGNVEIADINDLFQGVPGEAFHRLVPAAMELGVETWGGPLSIPHVLDYVGSEAQKAELRNIVRAAPSVARGVADLLRLFGSLS
jgi:hypothetical protein